MCRLLYPMVSLAHGEPGRWSMPFGGLLPYHSVGAHHPASNSSHACVRRSFLVPSCHLAIAGEPPRPHFHIYVHHYVERRSSFADRIRWTNCLLAGTQVTTASSVAWPAAVGAGVLNSSRRCRLARSSSCLASFVLIVRYSSSLRPPRACSSRNFVSNSLASRLVVIGTTAPPSQKRESASADKANITANHNAA